MENEAQMILDDTISFCERDGVDARLINMLRQSHGRELTDTTLTVEAPSRFAGAALMRQRETIERYLEEIAFVPIALNVVTALPAAGAAGGDVSRETSPRGAGPEAFGGSQVTANPQDSTAPEASVIQSGSTQAPFSAANAATGNAAFAPVPPVNPASSEAPVASYESPAPAQAAGIATATAAHPAPHPAVTPTIPTPAISLANQDETPAEAAGEGRINVTNTISASDLKRLMQTMNQGAPAAHHPAAVQSAVAAGGAPTAAATSTGGAGSYPAVPLNSKFTFENFVYGDENKHAYNSAVRFAVTAEDPGSYSSLFIYGKSGLGKTHLLLAIKNYLNENCPHLRVKYANSQAYIDDFINEVALQKDAHRAILRDYHDADVLIIDDIQNIIGKTASIDNFFSLMDEFIRNNKKVAIASDRAPKNLGMDERLTSRFNAGMLCLVSEPGFEMKFMILKHYYENTILPAAEESADATAGAGSLLSSIRTGGGHLSEEALKHMASVSGTNIRELESFCERCAGESFEREQEGKTLTGDDIDRIANEYFDSAHKKISVETVQKVVEDFYRVSHNDLIGPRRQAAIKNARHVAVYLTLDMCEMTTSMVGAAFGGRDHTTVLHSVKVIEKRMKEDRSFVDDLQQLRNKIILRS